MSTHQIMHFKRSEYMERKDAPASSSSSYYELDINYSPQKEKLLLQLQSINKDSLNEVSNHVILERHKNASREYKPAVTETIKNKFLQEIMPLYLNHVAGKKNKKIKDEQTAAPSFCFCGFDTKIWSETKYVESPKVLEQQDDCSRNHHKGKSKAKEKGKLTTKQPIQTIGETSEETLRNNSGDSSLRTIASDKHNPINCTLSEETSKQQLLQTKQITNKPKTVTVATQVKPKQLRLCNLKPSTNTTVNKGDQLYFILVPQRGFERNSSTTPVQIPLMHVNEFRQKIGFDSIVMKTGNEEKRIDDFTNKEIQTKVKEPNGSVQTSSLSDAMLNKTMQKRKSRKKIRSKKITDENLMKEKYCGTESVMPPIKPPKVTTSTNTENQLFLADGGFNPGQNQKANVSPQIKNTQPPKLDERVLRAELNFRDLNLNPVLSYYVKNCQASDLLRFLAIIRTPVTVNKIPHKPRDSNMIQNIVESSRKLGEETSESGGFEVEGIEPPKKIGFNDLEKVKKNLCCSHFSVIEIKPNEQNSATLESKSIETFDLLETLEGQKNVGVIGNNKISTKKSKLRKYRPFVRATWRTRFFQLSRTMKLRKQRSVGNIHPIKTSTDNLDRITEESHSHSSTLIVKKKKLSKRTEIVKKIKEADDHLAETIDKVLKMGDIPKNKIEANDDILQDNLEQSEVVDVKKPTSRRQSIGEIIRKNVGKDNERSTKISLIQSKIVEEEDDGDGSKSAKPSEVMSQNPPIQTKPSYSSGDNSTVISKRKKKKKSDFKPMLPVKVKPQTIYTIEEAKDKSSVRGKLAVLPKSQRCSDSTVATKMGPSLKSTQLFVSCKQKSSTTAKKPPLGSTFLFTKDYRNSKTKLSAFQKRKLYGEYIRKEKNKNRSVHSICEIIVSEEEKEKTKWMKKVIPRECNRGMKVVVKESPMHRFVFHKPTNKSKMVTLTVSKAKLKPRRQSSRRNGFVLMEMFNNKRFDEMQSSVSSLSYKESSSCDDEFLENNVMSDNIIPTAGEILEEVDKTLKNNLKKTSESSVNKTSISDVNKNKILSQDEQFLLDNVNHSMFKPHSKSCSDSLKSSSTKKDEWKKTKSYDNYSRQSSSFEKFYYPPLKISQTVVNFSSDSLGNHHQNQSTEKVITEAKSKESQNLDYGSFDERIFQPIVANDKSREFENIYQPLEVVPNITIVAYNTEVKYNKDLKKNVGKTNIGNSSVTVGESGYESNKSKNTLKRFLKRKFNFFKSSKSEIASTSQDVAGCSSDGNSLNYEAPEKVSSRHSKRSFIKKSKNACPSSAGRPSQQQGETLAPINQFVLQSIQKNPTNQQLLAWEDLYRRSPLAHAFLQQFCYTNRIIMPPLECKPHCSKKLQGTKISSKNKSVVPRKDSSISAISRESLKPEHDLNVIVNNHREMIEFLENRFNELNTKLEKLVNVLESGKRDGETRGTSTSTTTVERERRASKKERSVSTDQGEKTYPHRAFIDDSMEEDEGERSRAKSKDAGQKRVSICTPEVEKPDEESVRRISLDQSEEEQQRRKSKDTRESFSMDESMEESGSNSISIDQSLDGEYLTIIPSTKDRGSVADSIGSRRSSRNRKNSNELKDGREIFFNRFSDVQSINVQDIDLDDIETSIGISSEQFKEEEEKEENEEEECQECICLRKEKTNKNAPKISKYQNTERNKSNQSEKLKPKRSKSKDKNIQTVGKPREKQIPKICVGTECENRISKVMKRISKQTNTERCPLKNALFKYTKIPSMHQPKQRKSTTNDRSVSTESHNDSQIKVPRKSSIPQRPCPLFPKSNCFCPRDHPKSCKISSKCICTPQNIEKYTQKKQTGLNDDLPLSFLSRMKSNQSGKLSERLSAVRNSLRRSTGSIATPEEKEELIKSRKTSTKSSEAQEPFELEENRSIRSSVGQTVGSNTSDLIFDLEKEPEEILGEPIAESTVVIVPSKSAKQDRSIGSEITDLISDVEKNKEKFDEQKDSGISETRESFVTRSLTQEESRSLATETFDDEEEFETQKDSMMKSSDRSSIVSKSTIQEEARSIGSKMSGIENNEEKSSKINKQEEDKGVGSETSTVSVPDVEKRKGIFGKRNRIKSKDRSSTAVTSPDARSKSLEKSGFDSDVEKKFGEPEEETRSSKFNKQGEARSAGSETSTVSVPDGEKRKGIFGKRKSRAQSKSLETSGNLDSDAEKDEKTLSHSGVHRVDSEASNLAADEEKHKGSLKPRARSSTSSKLSRQEHIRSVDLDEETDLHPFKEKNDRSPQSHVRSSVLQDSEASEQENAEDNTLINTRSSVATTSEKERNDSISSGFVKPDSLVKIQHDIQKKRSFNANEEEDDDDDVSSRLSENTDKKIKRRSISFATGKRKKSLTSKDERQSSLPLTAKEQKTNKPDQQYTDQEMFDKILESYNREDDIADRLSKDDEFFQAQLSSVQGSKESVQEGMMQKKQIKPLQGKQKGGKLNNMFKRRKSGSVNEIVAYRLSNEESMDQMDMIATADERVAEHQMKQIKDDIKFMENKETKVQFSNSSLFQKERDRIFSEDIVSKETHPKQDRSSMTVEAKDIGKCFKRGFRPDNIVLTGEPCLKLSEKEQQNRVGGAAADATTAYINFSERDTPLEFLLGLGFSVDEASNAIKDEDVKNRLNAAITEARVWINKISTTQGTMLYLVAFKTRPKTMRYFLQLVEAIINQRITDAVKLDGFLKLLEKIEEGNVNMITILGVDKLDDEQNEENMVKKQLRKLFYDVYKIAEHEAVTNNKRLTKEAIILLRILAAKYRSGLQPHLELIAKYIGQGLLVNEVQLEAAMIYLARIDTAEINLKDFEEYCAISNRESKTTKQQKH